MMKILYRLVLPRHIYVLQITLFAPMAVYERVGYKGISFLHLLAYCSSCCNPITYCFMNSSFRKAFLKLFGCLREEKANSWQSVKFTSNRTVTTFIIIYRLSAISILQFDIECAFKTHLSSGPTNYPPLKSNYSWIEF